MDRVSQMLPTRTHVQVPSSRLPEKSHSSVTHVFATLFTGTCTSLHSGMMFEESLTSWGASLPCGFPSNGASVPLSLLAPAHLGAESSPGSPGSRVSG